MEEKTICLVQQEFELYQIFQEKMKECDLEIEKLLTEQINNDEEKRQHLLQKV